jgi:agmatine/peptidylarginine deiminase
MDFRFTGWGGKFEASRDDLLATRLFELGLFVHAEHRRVGWALEGGAIESDGQGTLMTTFRCLHHRHPHLSRGELAKVLDHHLQGEHVHMLDHGYLEGDDTDAHIDTLARFAPHRTIVYQGCDRADDVHFEPLRAMAAELATLRTRDGLPYRLIALPWAQAIHSAGRRLAASYANFLIINDAVLMPAYGDPADAHAQLLLAKAFAPRQIIPIPCRPLIEQNGSLHCVTMQVPAGALHVG